MSDANRIDAWVQELKPRGVIQTFLAVQAAGLSIKLEELRAVEAARTAHHRRTAAEAERRRRKAEAIVLGHELVDPALIVRIKRDQTLAQRRRGPLDPAPRGPELLIHLLEATAEGCRWLADSWSQLRALIDERVAWGTDDEHQAIRLSGKTPDMEDDADVRNLRLAVCVANVRTPHHLSELTEESIGRPVPTVSQAREMLREICTRNLDRLGALAAERDAAEGDDDTRHGFDGTAMGKDLRREQAASHRRLMQSLEQLAKLQKAPVKEEGPAADGPSHGERVAEPGERVASDPCPAPAQRKRSRSAGPLHGRLARLRSRAQRRSLDTAAARRRTPHPADFVDRTSPFPDRRPTPPTRQDRARHGPRPERTHPGSRPNDSRDRSRPSPVRDRAQGPPIG
jgi:hypothetical protein